MKAHDLLSPFLIGNKKADDEIHDAVQFSFKSGQMEMFQKKAMVLRALKSFEKLLESEYELQFFSIENFLKLL